MKTQADIFLIESPHNNYQPAPPDGWFGLRSGKRRVFMRLNNGRYPSPEEMQRRLDCGEFTEETL